MHVDVQAQQGSDRHKKQECLESLQLSFEKHMTEYEVRQRRNFGSLAFTNSDSLNWSIISV